MSSESHSHMLHALHGMASGVNVGEYSGTFWNNPLLLVHQVYICSRRFIGTLGQDDILKYSELQFVADRLAKDLNTL